MKKPKLEYILAEFEKMKGKIVRVKLGKENLHRSAQLRARRQVQVWKRVLLNNQNHL